MSKIGECPKCKGSVPYLNMNCPNCGQWYGYYKFTQTEEYQKEFGPMREE